LALPLLKKRLRKNNPSDPDAGGPEAGTMLQGRWLMHNQDKDHVNNTISM